MSGGKRTLNTKKYLCDRRIYLLIFASAVATRLIMLLLGLWVMKRTGNSRTFMDIFPEAGDAVHYLRIAREGYAASGENAKYIVFYPLYPLLIRIAAIVFRNYIFSAMFVSNVCFGAAACLMYALIRIDCDDEKAMSGVFALFAAPFGVFFMGIFTESLFVMLSLLALYFIRKKNWLGAGAAGALVSATRTQGLLLIVPAVYEIIIDAAEKKKFDKKYLFTLMMPLGFIVYLCINKIMQGSFFAYVAHQAAPPWYNTPAWIFEVLKTGVNMAKEHEALSYIIYHPQTILFFVSVAAIFYGLKKGVRTSYLAYCGVYTAMTYVSGWLISGSRYAMGCVPLYIIFASIENKYVKNTLMLLFTLLYVHITILWFAGYAIM